MDLVIRLLCLSLLFGIPVFLLIWRKRNRKRAAAVTDGKITDLRFNEHYDSGRKFVDGWYYSYSVDGKEYRKSQMLRFRVSPRDLENRMRGHIDEDVVVHYDPEHPKRAWAETPDRTGRL